MTAGLTEPPGDAGPVRAGGETAGPPLPRAAPASAAAARLPAREAGFALVAAVAAMVLFAMLALALVMATRARLAATGGEIARARADAAADAGFAIALRGLVVGDEATRAALDGRPRRIAFHDASLTLRLIDERGKIPVNQIEPATLERVLRAAGLDGAALDIARDSLLDWEDDDDDPRPDGAERAWYAPQGIAPRNGPIATIDELARIRGFTPALVARLRPILTAEPDAAPFAPEHAEPAAIAAMAGGDEDAAAGIDRAREQAGQRTALGFTDAHALLRRPITIAVDADVPGGGHVHREGVVVVTGNTARPYTIRNVR